MTTPIIIYKDFLINYDLNIFNKDLIKVMHLFTLLDHHMNQEHIYATEDE